MRRQHSQNEKARADRGLFAEVTLRGEFRTLFTAAKAYWKAFGLKQHDSGGLFAPISEAANIASAKQFGTTVFLE
jgi:hypothetical protein